MRQLLLCAVLALGCSEASEGESSEPFGLVAVTFNTGTGRAPSQGDLPNEGYGSEQSAYSDQYYGNGLAWVAAIDDVRAFFEENPVDVVGFQEIFDPGECDAIPVEAKPGFVCETWQAGQPTVAEMLMGEGFEVACHPGNPDKCIAVRKSLGTLAALTGFPVPNCGGGARIARGVVELAGGGTLTIVNIHGTSGITQEDQDCRVQQFSQVFVDLGDGAPGASGERNLILGDLNTDPGRTTDFDESAALFASHAGEGKKFHFVTEVGQDAPATYQIFNIDHVVSDTLFGSCWVAGLTEGHPPPTDVVMFDHKPHVCSVSEMP